MTNWVIVLSVPVQFSWAIAAWHEIILILIFNLQMSRIPREKPIPQIKGHYFTVNQNCHLQHTEALKHLFSLIFLALEIISFMPDSQITIWQVFPRATGLLVRTHNTLATDVAFRVQLSLRGRQMQMRAGRECSITAPWLCTIQASVRADSHSSESNQKIKQRLPQGNRFWDFILFYIFPSHKILKRSQWKAS